jgi:CheY-like chemotaxis protein
MITEIMDRKTKVLTVLKFLVVDDTKAMREEFGAICRTFLPNARIDEAADAVQAVSLINKEMPPYDAVFTDINMPKITGLQLISHIREMHAYQKTPVIVISAMSASDIKGLQLGAAGYLTKMLRERF